MTHKARRTSLGDVGTRFGGRPTDEGAFLGRGADFKPLEEMHRRVSALTPDAGTHDPDL